MGGVRGIIFDMDNTLLRSRIDYDAMKGETYRFLVAEGILPEGLDLAGHTTSTVIQKALDTKLMSAVLVRDMWEIPKKYEIAGMHQAELEPGVTELLAGLKGKVHLAVLTNNSVAAAEKALSENGILEYFDAVVGREMVNALKPSPDGMRYVLSLFSGTNPEDWLAVGDSWIDGKAAADAGIAFIAYRADLVKLARMGVHPRASLDDIGDVLHFVGGSLQKGGKVWMSTNEDQ